ncbi:hypothetical protein MNV49_006764 [Pseudohyphozyma bogoriensis]|nr:hypothetical protein MNV49_006764 [Pseudohyphozyma bogoriensis]
MHRGFLKGGSRSWATAAGFVYPTYASYKAIKSNDLPKLEVWLMYWSVMGTVMALESTVEWIFSWFPFYFEVKTIVILWLTLPQIQGSTYIYVAHLHPFLSSHESDIDAALADAKVRAKQVGLEYLNSAVQRLKQAVVGNLAPQLLEAEGNPPAQTVPHPPTLADPASNATSNLYNLAGNVLRTYGPAAVAAGTALLQPMNGRAPSVRKVPSRGEQMRSLGVDADRLRAEGASTGRTASLTSLQTRQRRAELEAQIAEIDSASSPPSSSSRSSHSSAESSPYRQAYPSYHPRSVSAGPYPASLSVGRGDERTASSSSLGPGGDVPRDPVAARIERSMYGFEEINKTELGDYPPPKAAAMQPGPVTAEKKDA